MVPVRLDGCSRAGVALALLVSLSHGCAPVHRPPAQQPHVQIEPAAPVVAPSASEKSSDQKSAEHIEPMTAETPAVEDPAPPPPWSGVVLRIEFRYPEKHFMGLGTGFIIRDQSGNDYLMTCAHLVDDGGWEARYRIRMRTMDHTRSIDDYGDTLHIGKSVDIKTRGRAAPDMTQDLIVRSVAGDWMQPLQLAEQDPKIGDSVWVVGCEAKDPPHDERFYAARIVEVGPRGYAARKLESFDPRGFSGGPVVNSAGLVVGNVLVGSESTVGGSVVTTIRRHLAEHGITPE